MNILAKIEPIRTLEVGPNHFTSDDGPNHFISDDVKDSAKKTEKKFRKDHNRPRRLNYWFLEP